jgi:hypothetical protein
MKDKSGCVDYQSEKETTQSYIEFFFPSFEISV